MKQFNKTPYYIYIAIGVMYVLVKIIFVSFDYLPSGAIAHGSIPAILTVIVGVLSLKERKKNANKSIWHWINIVFALLVFIITPMYMYIKMGGELWLSEGRLPVLIIYECSAIIQFVTAISIFRKNIINKSKIS